MRALLFILLIFATTAATATTALAQSTGRPDPWGLEPSYAGWEGLGAKAGLVLSTFRGNNTDQPGGDMGGAVGAYAAYRVKKHFRVRLELQWTTRGGSRDIPDVNDEPITLDTNLSYLAVPMLIEGVIPITDEVAAFVYGGVAPAFLLSASSELAGVSTDTKSITSSRDLEIIAGTSGELRVGPGRASLDLRVTFGTATIVDDPDEPFTVDVRNRAVLLLFGYSAL